MTLSDQFSWDIHIDEILKECSKKLNGMYKIQNHLTLNQKKKIVEGSILGRLRYAIEVITSGSDASIKRLESMQSKCARYVLRRSRKDWSRSAGYEELGWHTIPQVSVEFSIRLFLKILWNRHPTRIFKSIYDEEEDKVIEIDDDSLSKMRKLTRRSWRIRVLRYAPYIPTAFFTMDPNTHSLKSSVKDWVKRNIGKNGDFVFQGRISPPPSDDWLVRELVELRKDILHEEQSKKEINQLNI